MACFVGCEFDFLTIPREKIHFFFSGRNHPIPVGCDFLPSTTHTGDDGCGPRECFVLKSADTLFRKWQHDFLKNYFYKKAFCFFQQQSNYKIVFQKIMLPFPPE